MPEPRVRRTVELPVALDARLTERAAKEKTTVIEIIKRALEAYLKKD